MANVNEQLMGRKGARRFVARLAIGGGLRGSTRLKKEKDRSSEVAVTSDEKEETKQRGCSFSVLEGSCEGERGPKGVWGASRAAAATMTGCSVGLLDGRGRGVRGWGCYFDRWQGMDVYVLMFDKESMDAWGGAWLSKQERTEVDCDILSPLVAAQ
ncbi:uncharacterized protein LOC111914067 [Lactuca sativa]|uniref:Uncharacterized protein n=1 Tax=Lactuca sativa TaxID=4236 RepID=A0A9R1V2V2_LACSA|nr:uncharacterized protein LOC111914067 [Lactuca sativa]KAJ0199087.1 hypothetical protein LSAT_V11C600340720 [Lactuca sativa]